MQFATSPVVWCVAGSAWFRLCGGGKNAITGIFQVHQEVVD